MTKIKIRILSLKIANLVIKAKNFKTEIIIIIIIIFIINLIINLMRIRREMMEGFAMYVEETII